MFKLNLNPSSNSTENSEYYEKLLNDQHINELIFVDDGSTDATPELLRVVQSGDSRVRVVRLSRNFGHQAAISIHNHCQGVAVTERPPEGQTLSSTKMGLHEWSYSNDYSSAARAKKLSGRAELRSQ